MMNSVKPEPTEKGLVAQVSQKKTSTRKEYVQFYMNQNCKSCNNKKSLLKGFIDGTNKK